MPKGARADLLGDPGPSGHASYDPPCGVPVEALAVRPEEDWPVDAFTDRQIDRPGRAGRERDRDDLGARAEDCPRPMPTFEPKPVDVSPGRLRHAEALEGEQRDQGVLGCRTEAGGDEERPDLVAVQTGGVGLVVDAILRTGRDSRRRRSAAVTGSPTATSALMTPSTCDSDTPMPSFRSRRPCANRPPDQRGVAAADRRAWRSSHRDPSDDAEAGRYGAMCP